MKIGDKKTKVGTDPYIKKSEGKGQAKKSGGASKGGGPSSSVALSSRGMDMGRVKKMLDNVPEIRAEMVGKLKSEIDNGLYQVDTGKIAEKMIERALRNALFSTD